MILFDGNSEGHPACQTTIAGLSPLLVPHCSQKILAMSELLIQDRTEDGSLSFDLRDILRTIGENACISTWRLSSIEALGGEAAEEMHQLCEEGIVVCGKTLLRLADSVWQVVDGRFAATLPGDSEPWLIIEAVDSSHYCVSTDEQASLQPLRRRFRNVTG